MRVVLAVKELTKVPEAIEFAIRGLATDVTVKVVGWDHHNTTVNLPADPTPSAAYFQKVQDRLFKQPLIAAQPDTSATMIPVDADVLFQWWEKLDDGEHKKNIENMLRASPFWTVKEKQDLLKDMHLQTQSDTPSEREKGTTQAMPLRGSSSTAPATEMVEHELAVHSIPSIEEETLTGGASQTNLPSPTPHQNNFILNSPEEATQSWSNSANADPYGRDCRLGGPNKPQVQKPTAPQPSLRSGSHGISKFKVSAQNEQACKQNNSKRPAENASRPSSAKRSLERSLSNADAQPNTPLHSKGITAKEAAAHQAETQTHQAPILRRSVRRTKSNGKLSSFVVGSSSRKPRANKLKPDVVKEALVAAGLERCLDSNNLVADPLSADERIKIKNFCGIIDNDPIAVSVEEPAPLAEEEQNQDDDEMGDRVSGLDDSLSDELTDLEQEVQGE